MSCISRCPTTCHGHGHGNRTLSYQGVGKGFGAVIRRRRLCVYRDRYGILIHAQSESSSASIADSYCENDASFVAGNDTKNLSAGMDTPGPIAMGTGDSRSWNTADNLEDVKILPDLWPVLSRKYGNSSAIKDRHKKTPIELGFDDLNAMIQHFAAGLRSFGVKKGDRVSLFAENSARWLVADQGVMSCGAADAVRGVSSSRQELEYIAVHSKSSVLILQDIDTLAKLRPALGCTTSDGALSSGDQSLVSDYKEVKHNSALKNAVKFVIILNDDVSGWDKLQDDISCPIYSFTDVMDEGKSTLSDNPDYLLNVRNSIDEQDLATLVYTSGTTGRPKGVRLSHSNIIYQIKSFPEFIEILPGQQTLSLLPPWHVYERTCGYYILSGGACQAITNVKHFRQDLQRYLPNHFVCVPLVLDTLYSRVLSVLKNSSTIRRILAFNLLSASIAFNKAQRILKGVDLNFASKQPTILQLFKAWFLVNILRPLNILFNQLVAKKIRKSIGIKNVIVSGGGSLAPHLDDFYEAIGLEVLNGYGMTETSPVLACRSAVKSYSGNVRGSVGRQIPGTEIKIVDPKTFESLPDGNQGLILARGPGVTIGYEGDPVATAAAFEAGNGWLNTGDLGWRAPSNVPRSKMEGCIVLTGRSKDTIVLSSGENVEPQPIEDALCASPYIKFAIVIGQGHRSLGALIVTDKDALTAKAEQDGLEFLHEDAINELIREAIEYANRDRPAWEHVHQIHQLERPFSIEDGTLTRTMKPRRAAIMDVYAKEIEALEQNLR